MSRGLEGRGSPLSEKRGHITFLYNYYLVLAGPGWLARLAFFTRSYYCFVDAHFSSRDFATLSYKSTAKATNYRAAWNRFLASDDPGDCQLKPLYKKVSLSTIRIGG